MSDCRYEAGLASGLNVHRFSNVIPFRRGEARSSLMSAVEQSALTWLPSRIVRFSRPSIAYISQAF